MPLNDPAAYGPGAAPAGLTQMSQGMDPNIQQILSTRLQSLSPQEKAMLASLVTPQTAPALLKMMPELAAIMPRVATMSNPQQSQLPQPQRTSPLASTPITV